MTMFVAISKNDKKMNEDKILAQLKRVFESFRYLNTEVTMFVTISKDDKKLSKITM